MSLSIKDSYILKGLALLLLLCHHLFFGNEELYDDIRLYHDYTLFHSMGIVSKACVALFVFLSGYGLSEKHKGCENLNKKKFYIHRFRKLYSNYWIIWCLFIPISIFWLGPSVDGIVGIIRLLSDFLGISIFLGFSFYNTTWWFFSCILALYLFYPFLRKWIQSGHFFFMITISIVLVLLPFEYFKAVWRYLPAFVLGICFSEYDLRPSLHLCAWISILLLLLIERLYVSYGIFIDSLIASIIVIIYSKVRLATIIKRIFEYLGRHSMNIFYFHTFLFHIWFQDYIYKSRNPIIIYLTLLLTSLLISELIERLKRCLYFKSQVIHSK